MSSEAAPHFFFFLLKRELENSPASSRENPGIATRLRVVIATTAGLEEAVQGASSLDAIPSGVGREETFFGFFFGESLEELWFSSLLRCRVWCVVYVCS